MIHVGIFFNKEDGIQRFAAFLQRYMPGNPVAKAVNEIARKYPKNFDAQESAFESYLYQHDSAYINLFMGVGYGIGYTTQKSSASKELYGRTMTMFKQLGIPIELVGEKRI